MAKKALLIVLVAVFALAQMPGVLFAQTDNQLDLGNGQAYQVDQKLIEEYTEATKNCSEPSLECLVYYTTNYVAIQLIQNIVPIDNVGVDTSNQTPSLNTGLDIAQNRGIVPGLAHYIGQMYANPAASTPMYVAYLMESANLAPQAYAQGLGFGALNPILELWKTFRNIAYIFYVVIFIVIGFLIMFRKKVGQSAITAQQAIPNVIVSLLFVTFSYAIAGLLIDLMYLSMFLIVGLFQATFSSNPDIINYNIFELSATFIKHGAVEGFSAGSNIVESMINNIISNQTIAAAFGWVGGITVGLVIAIAVLIGAFKLFFELLKSYASIVLSVVVGPVQLMMGALPGNDTFTPWLKNLVANLAAFPTVLITAVMFFIFTQGTAEVNGGFMPPYLVGRGAPNAIATLMGLAILLALPEIVKEVKKRLGASEGFGMTIAQTALDRSKAAWRGDGIPGRIGAGAIAKTAGGIGLATAGAAGGGLVGGTIAGYRARKAGGSFREGFAKGGRKGAVIGGISGGVVGTGGSLVSAPLRGLNKISQPVKNINEAYDAYQDLRETRSLKQVMERHRARQYGVNINTSGRPASAQDERRSESSEPPLELDRLNELSE